MKRREMAEKLESKRATGCPDVKPGPSGPCPVAHLLLGARLRQRPPGTGTPYVSRSKPNLDHVSRPSVHPLWSMFFIQSVATGPYYSSYKTESRYVNNLGRYKANPFFDGNRLGMLRGGLWRGFRKIELEQLSGHVTKHVIQSVTCRLQRVRGMFR